MTIQLKSPRSGSAWYRFRFVVLLVVMFCGAGLSAFTMADQHGGISATEIYPTGQPTRIAPLIPELQGSPAGDSRTSDVPAPFREVFHERAGDAGWALLIPLFGIVFLFGGPVLVLIVVTVLHYRSKARRTELRAQILLKALETGRELPPALLPGDEVADAATNLRRGMRNIGLGFAILLPLGLLVGFDVGSLGFIPMSIGVAQVCIWRWVDHSAAQG